MARLIKKSAAPLERSCLYCPELNWLHIGSLLNDPASYQGQCLKYMKDLLRKTLPAAGMNKILATGSVNPAANLLRITLPALERTTLATGSVLLEPMTCCI